MSTRLSGPAERKPLTRMVSTNAVTRGSACGGAGGALGASRGRSDAFKEKATAGAVSGSVGAERGGGTRGGRTTTVARVVATGGGVSGIERGAGVRGGWAASRGSEAEAGREGVVLEGTRLIVAWLGLDESSLAGVGALAGMVSAPLGARLAGASAEGMRRGRAMAGVSDLSAEEGGVWAAIAAGVRAEGVGRLIK